MQTPAYLVNLAENGHANAMFEIGHRMAFGKSWKNPRPWKTNILALHLLKTLKFVFFKKNIQKHDDRNGFFIYTCSSSSLKYKVIFIK